jgi:hypothetical protein
MHFRVPVGGNCRPGLCFALYLTRPTVVMFDVFIAYSTPRMEVHVTTGIHDNC